MIRVGFILNLSDSWLGGVNYFRNLILAISETLDINITPVIFTGTKINHELVKDFPDVEWVKSPLFDRWSIPWTIRKVDEKIFSFNVCLNNLFKRYNVDVLSHTPEMISGLKIPMIGWIPDFQHKYLTNFFSEKDIKHRDKSFEKLCSICQSIIVSSYDAKKDLEKFNPAAVKKAHVLQFVVQPPSSDIEVPIDELEKTYGFTGKYFYVPNQFWVHKNHKVILEALNILKQQGHKVCVISTGNTVDYRNPEHFAYISNLIKKNNLSSDFIVLGKVPYSHVVTFAENCLALINPSLFEGWSTTVEEAKSLGKKIILSSIPIHKEQNPPGGVYFDTENPNALAEALLSVWQSKDDNIILKKQAKQNLKHRRINFAKTYEDIILKVLREKC